MDNLQTILANLGIEPTEELAKAIKDAIQQDEQAEYEQGMRDAMYCEDCGALYEEECYCNPGQEEECGICGGYGDLHRFGCIFADPLDYENCGFG